MVSEKSIALFARYNEILQELMKDSRVLTESISREALLRSLAEIYNIPSSEVVKYSPTSSKPVDIHTVDNGSYPKLAFELHVENSPRSQANKTQRAGVLFQHIHRLASFHPEEDYERYLIFNTDETMARYFSTERKSNDLTCIWHLPIGQTVLIDNSYYRGRSISFTKYAKGDESVRSCNVINIHKVDKFGHPWYWTRVYRVEPLT